MAGITFYTDTHIAKAVAVQLRGRGINVVRCEEVGMAEASDEAHLRYAARETRVLITQDDDFAALHAEWMRRGDTHTGIMLVPKHLQGEAQISFIVERLAEYAELIAGGAGTIQDDITNHLIFL